MYLVLLLTGSFLQETRPESRAYPVAFVRAPDDMFRRVLLRINGPGRLDIVEEISSDGTDWGQGRKRGEIQACGYHGGLGVVMSQSFPDRIVIALEHCAATKPEGANRVHRPNAGPALEVLTVPWDRAGPVQITPIPIPKKCGLFAVQSLDLFRGHGEEVILSASLSAQRSATLLVRSKDRGSTWTQPEYVLNTTSPATPPAIVFAGGRLHSFPYDQPKRRFLHGTSSDFGAKWEYGLLDCFDGSDRAFPHRLSCRVKDSKIYIAQTLQDARSTLYEMNANGDACKRIGTIYEPARSHEWREPWGGAGLCHVEGNGSMLGFVGYEVGVERSGGSRIVKFREGVTFKLLTSADSGRTWSTTDLEGQTKAWIGNIQCLYDDHRKRLLVLYEAHTPGRELSTSRLVTREVSVK